MSVPTAGSLLGWDSPRGDEGPLNRDPVYLSLRLGPQQACGSVKMGRRHEAHVPIHVDDEAACAVPFVTHPRAATVEKAGRIKHCWPIRVGNMRPSHPLRIRVDWPESPWLSAVSQQKS